MNTQAVNTSNWISVKNSLPLAPGQYMVVIQNQWDPRTRSITFDRWDGKNWDVNREYTFWCPVTHWMECPELPNE
jgi:hypothetical protein